MSETLPNATAKNPTVLFVGAFVPSSQGSRGISEDVSIRLCEAGWNVTLTSRSANKLGRLADIMATCWRQRKSYDVAAIDVYSGMAFGWAEAACWVLRKAGKRYVLMLHGGNLPTFAKEHPERVRKLLDSATAVTAPSRYLQESMRPYRQHIFLIPNALDLAAYPFRERHEGGPQLIWLRAFHDTYNPVLAVQVFARLAAEFPELELRMVGPDKGDGSLESAVRETARLGVTQRVKFTGTVPKQDVPTWLAAGNIFLNTTRADNTPVSVMEAMACGLCIVSTNVGGVPYLLEHERTALLVAPDDAEAMAAAVRRILHENDLAGRLSRQARQDAETFDWPAVTRKWDLLLRTVADLVAMEQEPEPKLRPVPLTQKPETLMERPDVESTRTESAV